MNLRETFRKHAGSAVFGAASLTAGYVAYKAGVTDMDVGLVAGAASLTFGALGTVFALYRPNISAQQTNTTQTAAPSSNLMIDPALGL